MADEANVQEAFFAKATAIVARVMEDGTIAAASREAVKDVRNMFNEVFFGHAERGGEIGAAMNPTYSDLVEAQEFWQEAMTASEIARDDRPYLPEHDKPHDQSQEQGR